MTKAIKKNAKVIDPFNEHTRSKERNLPFLKASRVLITDEQLKQIFKLREYNGSNELGDFTEDLGFLDTESVLKYLIFELLKCKSLISKLEKNKDD